MKRNTLVKWVKAGNKVNSVSGVSVVDSAVVFAKM